MKPLMGLGAITTLSFCNNSVAILTGDVGMEDIGIKYKLSDLSYLGFILDARLKYGK